MKTNHIIVLVLILMSFSLTHTAFNELHKQLTADQEDEIYRIIKENVNNPITELRSSLNKYVVTLPKEVQSLVKKERQRLQAELKKTSQKVKKLSVETQKVYKGVEDLQKLDSISIREMMRRIKDIFAKANAKVAKELRDAKIDVVDPHSFL